MDSGVDSASLGSGWDFGDGDGMSYTPSQGSTIDGGDGMGDSVGEVARGGGVACRAQSSGPVAGWCEGRGAGRGAGLGDELGTFHPASAPFPGGVPASPEGGDHGGDRGGDGSSGRSTPNEDASLLVGYV